MRLPLPPTLVGTLLALAAPAGPALPAAPTPAAPRGIHPLLPNEGLLRGGTWLAMGERLLARTIDFLPSLIAAVLVLLFFVLASRLADKLLRRMLHRPHVDATLVEIVVPLARYTVLVFGLIMALSQAGFEVGSLLAGVGVAGLAIGLAAQDTLGNLIAGFSVLWDRPFRIGDRVTIGDTYGAVVGIGLRSTRLRTNDQLDVILPNREVVNKVIVNHTLTPNLRISAPFSVPYSEDVGRVRRVILAALDADAGLRAEVRTEPPPQVVVKKLGESALDMELRAWLVDVQHERPTRWALLELVKAALDEAKVASAYPRRTISLDRESPPLRVEITGTVPPAPAPEPVASPDPRAED